MVLFAGTFPDDASLRDSGVVTRAARTRPSFPR
jgi:hypothetical protein